MTAGHGPGGVDEGVGAAGGDSGAVGHVPYVAQPLGQQNLPLFASTPRDAFAAAAAIAKSQIKRNAGLNDNEGSFNALMNSNNPSKM